MKVYMDLVYLHCGPNNVMKDMFPDAFQKNEDGTVRTTKWHFPYVNFESKGVRKYLIDSMLHWVRLGCDGFRCDVGDGVPIDFWVEAVTACQKVKPDLVMINEGSKVEWLEKAFDACYAFPFSFAVRDFLTPAVASKPFTKGKTLPYMMNHMRAYEAKVPADALMMCFMDNHDSAAKYDGPNRFDRVHPVEAGNAGFVLVFLRRGLPMIFNGAQHVLRSGGRCRPRAQDGGLGARPAAGRAEAPRAHSHAVEAPPRGSRVLRRHAGMGDERREEERGGVRAAARRTRRVRGGKPASDGDCVHPERRDARSGEEAYPLGKRHGGKGRHVPLRSVRLHRSGVLTGSRKDHGNEGEVQRDVCLGGGRSGGMTTIIR